MKPAHGIMVEVGVEYLVNKAARIVVGEVESMESRWDSEHSMIYTYMTIGVDEHVKGKHDTKEVIVRVEGGEVGAERLWVEDTPSFEQGERVLLFLRPAGEGYFKTIGGFQGMIPLERNTRPFRVWRRRIQAIMEGKDPAKTLKEVGSSSDRKPERRAKITDDPPHIDSISPSKMSVGTDSVLTITGTGFGAGTSSDTLFFFKNVSYGDTTWVFPLVPSLCVGTPTGRATSWSQGGSIGRHVQSRLFLSGCLDLLGGVL
ncbi:MAG: IPT/TIG domain-containing protein [Candidatus Latescibacterota bacterium]